jgi:hypothetical protein
MGKITFTLSWKKEGDTTLESERVDSDGVVITNKTILESYEEKVLSDEPVLVEGHTKKQAVCKMLKLGSPQDNSTPN